MPARGLGGSEIQRRVVDEQQELNQALRLVRIGRNSDASTDSASIDALLERLAYLLLFCLCGVVETIEGFDGGAP